MSPAGKQCVSRFLSVLGSVEPILVQQGTDLGLHDLFEPSPGTAVRDPVGWRHITMTDAELLPKSRIGSDRRIEFLNPALQVRDHAAIPLLRFG